MILVSSLSRISDNNEVNLEEVMVSDERTVCYVLRRGESFVPYPYPFKVEDLWLSYSNTMSPSFYMSEPRVYERDDDARSLAEFFSKKLQSLDTKRPGAGSVLFDVITGFGSPWGRDV